VGTSATISVPRPDGRVDSVYVNFDGDPARTGKLLKERYNSLERAREIIALGNLSFLAESLETCDGHSFDTPVKGHTVAYGRDRGEEDEEASVRDTWGEVRARSHTDYNYIFDDHLEKWICDKD
jgi:hypothetical protein